MPSQTPPESPGTPHATSPSAGERKRFGWPVALAAIAVIILGIIWWLATTTARDGPIGPGDLPAGATDAPPEVEPVPVEE